MARSHILTQEVETLYVPTAVQCLPSQSPVPRQCHKKHASYPTNDNLRNKKDRLHKASKSKGYRLAAKTRLKGKTNHHIIQHTRGPTHKNHKSHSQPIPKGSKSTRKNRAIAGCRSTSNRSTQNQKGPGTLFHDMPEHDTGKA